MSKISNTSGLEPRGRAVLLEMYEPEQLRATSILIPVHVKEKTSILEQRAIVIAIGPNCWFDEGEWKPFFFGLLRRWVRNPRARVGEKVLVTRFAGHMTIGPADGKLYRLVNDRDIFAAIVEETITLSEEERKVVNG